MNKLITAIVALTLVLGLTQCRSKNEKNIVGVWQLQQLTANGTAIPGASMGNWLWEFNEAGGYLSDVAGMRAKGVYTLKDSNLTLRLGKDKNKAGQVYVIDRLDSVEMDLSSMEATNKTSLRFKRRDVGDVTQEKD